MNNIKLYIYYDKSEFEKGNFDNLKYVSYNSKAAIGAGASGIFPELHFLTEVNISIAELILIGLFEKIGSDIWKRIKKIIKKLYYIKPKKHIRTYGFIDESSLKAELLWYLQLKEIIFIIHIYAKSKADLNKALINFPKFLIKVLKSKSTESRLIYDDEKWKAY